MFINEPTTTSDRKIRRLGRVFEHYFGPRGREFDDPIFKNSNGRAVPGGGLLKFRVDRRA